jgi:cytochrome c-type biogenesis protein
MEQLLTHLSHAVEGAPLLALLASAAWGMLSIILSPCHLASIPLIVGFISGQERQGTSHACRIATLFAVGILLTIAAIGAATAAAGRMAGDVGAWANYLVAGVLIVVGLHLLGAIPMPWSGPAQPNPRRRGPWAAFLLGLIFGVALGPCTFAYMAPMLAVTFKLAQAAPVYAGSLLLAYGVGHCAVIVLAGTFTGMVQRFLDWNDHSRSLTLLKGACGVLVILGGLWLIYTTP